MDTSQDNTGLVAFALMIIGLFLLTVALLLTIRGERKELRQLRQGAIEAGVGRWQAEVSDDGEVSRHWQWRGEDGQFHNVDGD